MVDIESADATSAPVISVRFKLASFFVEQKRRTARASVGSRRLHVFPDLKITRCRLASEVSPHLPNYLDRPEPTRIAPVDLHL
jgi:hypothetical protein